MQSGNANDWSGEPMELSDQELEMVVGGLERMLIVPLPQVTLSVRTVEAPPVRSTNVNKHPMLAVPVLQF